MKGINAKLAARLTGWKTDIKSQSQAQELYEELLEQERMEQEQQEIAMQAPDPQEPLFEADDTEQTE